MVNKTIKELKQIAQRGLQLRYGFAPTITKIKLLEACNDGTYILFKVLNVEYRFDSHLMDDGSVWVDEHRVSRIGLGEEV